VALCIIGCSQLDCCCACIQEATGGTAEARVVLVTGANMGGKSTLMRQVGCIIILAQLVSNKQHVMLKILQRCR